MFEAERRFAARNFSFMEVYTVFSPKITESSVSVTLSKNSFDKDSYIVRVPRKTLDLANIVSDIRAGYPSLDPYVINHAAELIKEQILKYLKAGKAVNILELGTMYLAPKGTVPRSNPQVSDLPELTLKFTPSKAALESLASLNADSFMVNDPAPQISRITSLKDGNTDGILYQGYPVRLSGDRLKVGGENAGIFFVPVNSDRLPDSDEGNWIAADLSYLPRNVSKTLEFHIPAQVQTGTEYFIAVRTSFVSSGVMRKEAIVGYSVNPVTVSPAGEAVQGG